MMRWTMVLGFVLAGCTGGGMIGPDKASGDDTDGTETTDAVEETTDAPCEINVDSTYPAADAVDVYYRIGAVEVTFSEELSDGLLDVAGAPGTAIFDGAKMRYVFDGPLVPATTYAVDVTYCDGTQTGFSFTTSDVGEPVSDVDELVDQTFELDFDDPQVRVVRPEGIGSLILQDLVNFPVLVGVIDAGDGEVGFVASKGVQGSTSQDLCEVSLGGSGDFSQNPYFEVSLGDIPLGQGAVLRGAAVSGAFNEDGPDIEGGRMSGKLDVAHLEMPDIDGGGDDVCALYSQFGVPCEDCDGNAATTDDPYCVSVLFENIPGVLIPDLVLEAVTEEDVAANPDCSAPAPTP